MSKDWFVNAPGSKSPAYGSKKAAKNAARSLKGAKVSRKQTKGGSHKVSDSHKGGWCPLVLLGILAVPAGALAAIGYGISLVV